jgi:hypothetical protein
LPGRGKGTSFFSLRLPKAIRVRLENEAGELGVSASTYVRTMLVAHFSFQRGENQGVTHTVTHPPSFDLDHAVKQFILACYRAVSTAGLPGKERRNDLAHPTWRAVDEAVKFSKPRETLLCGSS